MVLTALKTRLFFIAVSAFLFALQLTSCAKYDGKFILRLKVKNCSANDRTVSVGHNPNVKMPAEDFLIPAKTQKIITWGSQCWQCGSDYSCAGISFQVKSPTNLKIGDIENDGASCPEELGRHEVSITCDDASCGATKVSGEIKTAAAQEPQC